MKVLVALCLLAVAFADCTSYCTLYQATCNSTLPIYFNDTICMNECWAFPNVTACDAATGSGCTGVPANSEQCREYHINAAISTADLSHCFHAAPTSGWNVTNGPCVAPAVAGVTNGDGYCDDYCNSVLMACNASVFPSQVACLSACKNVPGNMNATYVPMSYPYMPATSTDNLLCRRYHAQAARMDPVTHCSHATIGNGVCGSNCEFYCDQFMASCVDTTIAYTSRAACLTSCAGFDATGMWSDTTGNTLQCRTYHALVATQGDLNNTHCVHAAAMPTAYCVAASSSSSSTAGSSGTGNGASTLAGSAILVFAAALSFLFHH